MSILSDLRAALDKLKDARHVNRHSPDDWTGPRVDRAMGDLTDLLTDNTIRALLNVAEAAERESDCPLCGAETHTAGRRAVPEPHMLDCPLAPLVKEADHE